MTKAGESIIRGAQESLDIARQEKWDLRFLEFAELTAKSSKDPSTKCGAVIVRPDRSVCATGYNGFPRGMEDTKGRYFFRENKLSRVIHCEMNALMSSNDHSVKGYTLYTWPFLSCDRCAVHMIQAGIVRAVAPQLEILGRPADWILNWQRTLAITRDYYQECGVEVKEFEPGCKK